MNCTSFHQTGSGNSLSRNANEKARFQSILERLFNAAGKQRSDYRKVIVEYLKFSTISDELISTLINSSIRRTRPDRLDVPIDILQQLGNRVYDYAYQFLIDDIKSWSHLNNGRAYEPNDDYWFILLRSVARSDADVHKRFRYANMCAGATSRGVLEGVVEALGDIGSADAYRLLEVQFINHDDPFIAELAREVCQDR